MHRREGLRLIVVYCASDTCDASPKAAKRLEKMGYENVIDYPGGKKDWAEGGLRLVQSGEETLGDGDN